MTRNDVNSNEYTLTVTIPVQVSHDFEATLLLQHPYAKKDTRLLLQFTAQEGNSYYGIETAKSQPATYDNEEGWFTSSQAPSDSISKGSVSWTAYIFFGIAIFAVVAFMLNSCFGVDLKTLMGDRRSREDRRGAVRPQYGYGGVREARMGRQSFDGGRSFQRDQSYRSYDSDIIRKQR